MMNEATNTKPLLFNLSVGDMVSHRLAFEIDNYAGMYYENLRGSTIAGIVTDIRETREFENCDTMHVVVDVSWIAGAWSEQMGTYAADQLRLADGSRVLMTPSAPMPAPVAKAKSAPRPRATRTAPAAPATVAPAETATATAKKQWSKVEIVAMIKERPGAIDRGVLCLNKHAALLPEKTRSFVAFWAGWVASGKTLSGKHLVNARRTCLFNVKVIVDAANGKI
jgi:hypothetical protein